MQFIHKKYDNHNFKIQIDINIRFCMPQGILNKKTGLESEKLK